MTSHRSSALDVRDLRVATDPGGRTLARDVSFTLGRGETLGIVGESGSGKSLSMRAVMGLLPRGVSATGAVHLDGQDILGAPAAELEALRGTRLTMMFQDPFTMLNPLMRAGDQVAERLKDPSRTEVTRRLAEVGISDPAVARRFPFELSGGLRQRVGLAAALAGDPDILIADEPSTALDVTTQAEIVALLRETSRKRGMSLILITHDLRLAFSTCDRVLVLYAGTTVELGRTDDVAAMPMHPYTLGLLMSEPPLDRRFKQIYAMPGGVPAPDDVAHRCAFSDRCDWATEACRQERPDIIRRAEEHFTACRRQPEIAPEMDARRAAHLERATAAETVVTTPPVLLRVSGLNKSFGRTHVLHDAALEIGSGECVGLVGESGSGKTTLARCIVGLERAESGTVELADDGRLIPGAGTPARLAAFRKRVQFIFQDPYSTLNPRHTIRTCLREILRANAIPGDHEVIMRDLLGQVGLPDGYLSRYPAQLSGGERQRIAIARAMAVEPDILVCDEAVSALDVSVQAQVLNLLKRLRCDRGLSYLFVTHDLAVVRQIADRLYVMHKGRIVEHGPTDRVMNAPQDPYTKQLMTSVSGIE